MICKWREKKMDSEGRRERVAPLACQSGLGSVGRTKAHMESKLGSKRGRQEIVRKG